MAKVAATLSPKFYLIGGDFAYESGYPACYNRYDRLLSLMESLLISKEDQTLLPMILTIGNHEVDGEYKKSKVSSPKDVPFFFDYFPHYSPKAMKQLEPSHVCYSFSLLYKRKIKD